jgi:hypothetical protein
MHYLVVVKPTSLIVGIATAGVMAIFLLSLKTKGK